MEIWKEFDEFLKSVRLFKDIETSGLNAMLACVGVRTQKLKKGKIVLLAGNKPEHVGIVLSGQLHIIRDDYDGNRSLIAAVTPGEIFAEALCCADVTESPVTVIAAVDSTVMLLTFSRIMNTCSASCLHHKKLIENLLKIIAGKNIMLQDRMEIISLKSVREKVMLFLESFSPKRKKGFVIPFNREEMADYLSVERSALSHELAKMKKDGLIEYRKNLFMLM